MQRRHCALICALLFMTAWPLHAAMAADSYDVILLMGASNAIGRGIGDPNKINETNKFYLAQASRVFQLGRYGADDMQIVPAVEPLQNWDQIPGQDDPSRKGTALPFALRYASTLAPDRKVLIIPAAHGSTSILQWDDETMPFKNHDPDSPVLIDDAMNRLAYALSLNPANRLAAVLWDEGEADVLALANPLHPVHPFISPDLYRRKLEWLFAKVRGQRGCVPFMIVGLSRRWQPYGGRPAGVEARRQIIDAQKQAEAQDACRKAALVDTVGLTVLDYNDDLAHFSAQGARKMGAWIFRAFETIAATASRN